MSGFKAGSGGNKNHQKSQSTLGGSVTGRKLSAGVKDGLSEVSGFSTDPQGPGMMHVDYARDPMTGNATERIVGNPKHETAKKGGKSFDIC